MALTESQIKERNNKIREEFADTEEKLNEIHEEQMAELPEDYESKLKEAVDAANESFKKNAQQEGQQETVAQYQEAEVPRQEVPFSYIQSAIFFSSVGLVVGILFSFAVFRRMLKKVKDRYEARLSESRESLDRMIKIVSEQQKNISVSE